MRDKELSLSNHLGELRHRLVWSLAVLGACIGLSFAFHQQLLEMLLQPAEGFAEIPTGKPIYTDLTEFLGAAMKVSLIGGVIVALPFVLYQTIMFVAPGLTTAERRWLHLLLPLSVVAFGLGAAFGYRILFPPAISFLTHFGEDVATPQIRIGPYVNLMVSLLFWMGLVFEIPLVLFFLSKIGVVTPEWLAGQRRYAIVVAFILGAMITPTFDPINQTFVALPIVLLYELGIWLAKLAARGRRKKSSSDEAAEKH